MNCMLVEVFLNRIKEINFNYQDSLDSLYRKYNGVYYTGLELATSIIDNLLKNQKIDKIWELKFLEPAVGIGNFVFAYLYYISKKYTLTDNQVIELYSNLYACDNDDNALQIYAKLLRESAIYFFSVELPEGYVPNLGKALVFDLNSSEVTYVDIKNYFGNIKFDLVATNPPYKSLRAELKHYSTNEEYIKDKYKYDLIKNAAGDRYIYSERTNANIYKFFVEEILENYTTKDALVALLIPGSFLTDVSSASLRKHILDNYKVNFIGSINESNSFIDANQSLCYLTINKKEKSDLIHIIKNPVSCDELYHIEYKDISRRTYYEIILLEEKEQEILRLIESLPKFKDFDFIKILRGELDLTLNKSYITRQRTDFPLLKGRHIKKYGKLNKDFSEFVDISFINQKSKAQYINKNRIVCQQISNMNKSKRLVFMEVPEGFVLGNSCNFILVNQNPFGITLDYLLGLLNSSIYNWYFKLFSSNNHINNYEMKELPLPINNKTLIDKVVELVNEMKVENSNLISRELDAVVLDLINNQTTEETVKKTMKKTIKEDYTDKFHKDVESGIIEKNKQVLNREILNNHKYKLSELDLEVIKSVPPGGNWNNIPQSIMNKSKRLLGIQKSGSRTTLYGRLDYNKPSYTITTYFNRPGNGCNIHPVENRVLTTREAARLQGFFDDYLFWGNQKDILNQIGNAVPPPIGFLFGQKFKEKLDITKSMDLFSGAGGLATGIKESGIDAVIANDIDYSAAVTFKINHPEVQVLCDDITKKDVKDKLINLGKSLKVDLICGGPPCQGFSLAGFRKDDDSRNKLFIDFVDVVESIKPKAFIFENVQGLLSYKGGKIFLEIKQFFENIGYKLHADTLNFVEYGVPQKRKRVIIVGIRKDLNFEPIDFFPDMVTYCEENQITVYDSINDLDKLNGKKEKSNYQKMIKKEITMFEYYDFLKKGTESQSKIIKQITLFDFL